MLPTRGSSRGVCFNRILRKNIAHPSGAIKKVIIPEAKGAYCKEDAEDDKPDYSTPCSPEMLIDRYKNEDLHPVTLLHHLSKSLHFQLDIKETANQGVMQGFYFAFCVVIDGVEYKTGVGSSKKEARRNAAKLALDDLLPALGHIPALPEKSDVPPPLPVKKEPVKEEPNILQVSCGAIHERKNTVNLQIPYAVRDQLTKLMNNLPDFSNCAGTTAAFIIQHSSGCEVVALGTGNYNTRVTTSTSGRIVHDSHGVVTARRSLMRFLYRHLLMFFSRSAALKEKSIFQKNTSSDLLSLKSDIKLHLYVNQLPKGAAQLPSRLRLNPLSISAWEVNNEICLHLSVEGKIFSVLSSVYGQSTSKVVSLSTADKITQWQVVGYQGALLSHFIDPVYVHSILIGGSGCKDIKGIEISVCQRMDGMTSQLPIYYCVQRPQISLVPSVATCGTDGAQWTYGINWSEGDSSLEVVDGLEGKTIEGSPFKSGPALASRLCKAAMLHRFTLVAKEAQRQDLLAKMSYGEAKRMAKSYQEAKRMLKAYLSQQGLGSWLSKCYITDNFSM